jgi:putative heme transporter
MTSTPATDPTPDATGSGKPGLVIRVAGDYAWRILAIGTVGYFAIKLLTHLAFIVVPFIASILVTALLTPLFNRFRMLRLARGWATLATMLASVVVVGGLIAIVITRAAEQAPKLGNEINSLIPQVKHWLITGPLKVNPNTVNKLGTTVTNDVTKNSSKIASIAFSTGKTALTVLGEIALGIFTTVLLLYDGPRIWAFLLKGAPASARPVVNVAGRAAWATVSHYVRGTLVVAFFHGVVVGVTLTILGVPLAFPLAVLVGLGSFVPLVGAFVTGSLAVAVAGLSQGLLAAVIVVGVLLLDNQIEAHLLQPLVVGRYVRIHPLAVVLALGAGGVLWGIFGAVIAVPVVASVNSAIRAVLAYRDPTRDVGTIPTEGG